MNAVRYSPDGDFFVTGGADGKVSTSLICVHVLCFLINVPVVDAMSALFFFSSPSCMMVKLEI